MTRSIRIAIVLVLFLVSFESFGQKYYVDIAYTLRYVVWSGMFRDGGGL